MTEKNKPYTPAIGEEQLTLLEKLSNAIAISGDEGEIRTIILDEIKTCADDYVIDAMGNLLVTRKAKVENPLRVMIATHMDEVGFMLVDSDEGGLFRFETVGGVDPRQLVGKSVWVGKEHIPGVIGARAIHLTTAEERKNAIPLDNLRIDLGPEGDKKAKPGDRAGFATRFFRSGPSVIGKAFDNRLGVATLIELVKHAPENIELLAAFTVQEEIGLRGANVAAYRLNPDLAFVIDSTPAHDLPVWDGSENTQFNVRLDAGPAIYTADGVTLSDPRLIGHLTRTGDAMGIPYQFRQPGGGGTDGGAIHKRRAGIPTVSVSVPGRYAHTAVLVARIADWQNTYALVYYALERLNRNIFDLER